VGADERGRRRRVGVVGALARFLTFLSVHSRALADNLSLTAQTSPLALHLAPGTTITHLDDLELDAVAHGVPSALELWQHALEPEPVRAARRTDDPYERLGWCVPAGSGSAWGEVPSGREDGDEACCAAPGGAGEDDAAPLVCFTARAPSSIGGGTRSGAPIQACLDPLARVPPAPEPAPRCVDDESCAAGSAAGSVCARISARERVLRIGVVDRASAVGAGARTVLYQGERGAVLRQGASARSFRARSLSLLVRVPL